MIKITKQEYISLRRDQATLRALEAGGVDNWDWYGESLPTEEELAAIEEEANELEGN